jgi:nucleoside-diphosphate kinase
VQQTLVLIKCDALERGLTGGILSRFENTGLRVTDCRLVRPTLAQLSRHYAELKQRHPVAFRRTTRYLQKRPLLAIVLAAPNAIIKARSLLGPTDPCAAPPGTIRGDFGSDTLAAADAENRATLNLVHAADSPAAARREIKIWFA